MELFYSIFPLVKDEYNQIISDQNAEIKKDSLLFWIAKLFDIYDLNFEEKIDGILDRIMRILSREYNVKLVMIFDQINELKLKKESKKMEFIYNLILKKTGNNLSLIQCASNNNIFTRDNYKDYILKRIKTQLIMYLLNFTM